MNTVANKVKSSKTSAPEEFGFNLLLQEHEQHSTSCKIGNELLNLSGNETLPEIYRKLQRAAIENSEHLAELLMVATTAAAVISETKEDLVRFTLSCLNLSDACLA